MSFSDTLPLYGRCQTQRAVLNHIAVYRQHGHDDQLEDAIRRARTLGLNPQNTQQKADQ